MKSKASGNDKDYAASRVAYKLDLKGPAFSIQSACSSSLVSVATACQALLDYHCDMALTGGVSISLPEKLGYLAGQDGALSRDACCHAFDHRASKIIYSNGTGIVLLKHMLIIGKSRQSCLFLNSLENVKSKFSPCPTFTKCIWTMT